MNITASKNKYCKTLLKKKNVVAVGVGKKNGRGPHCVVVSVVEKKDLMTLKKKDRVPRILDDGALTDVVEVGEIWALQSRTDKVRPAPGGVSIGHFAITAGTLGCVVEKEGQPFILSNNHVLANSNDASIGDPVLQPGPHDGGTSNDQIGRLYDYVPVNFGGAAGGGNDWLALLKQLLCQLFGFGCDESGEPNLVDAAIAAPNSPGEVTPLILEVGPVNGTSTVTVGDRVKKSGRTTGLTEDEVLQTDATVQVQYGEGKVATFNNQIIAGPMSAGGDSGSLVLDSTNKAVGLLFAGSDQVTILNPISHVLSKLNVRIKMS